MAWPSAPVSPGRWRWTRQILFCDEPASGLDPATAMEIDDLLIELNQYLGVTLVVITHELATIENISRPLPHARRRNQGIIA